MNVRNIFATVFLVGLGPFASALAITPRGEVEAIACTPSNSKAAAALVDGAVWITDDSGLSWTKLASLPVDAADETDPASQYLDADLAAPEEIVPGMKSADETEESKEQIESQLEDPAATTADFESDDQPEQQDTRTLSVTDQGLWAATWNNQLFAGGPGPGIEMRLELGDLRGAVIDRTGRIWAVTGQAVSVLDSSSGYHKIAMRLPIAGGSAPTLGPHGAGILIATSLGLWIAAYDEKDRAYSHALHRIGPVDAATFSERNGQFFAAIRGALWQWASGTSLVELSSLPARSTHLLVGWEDTTRYFAKAGPWLERTEYGWRPMAASSMAVDAAGRVWFGTNSGPIAPPAGPGKPVEIAAADTDMALLLQSAMHNLASALGPPPCPNPLQNLLPTARIVAVFGNLTSRRDGLPEATRQGQMQSGFYVGLHLSWQLEWYLPTDCLSQQRSWQELRIREALKLQALWTAWQKTNVETTGDPAEMIANQMEQERLAQTIRLMSGVLPKKRSKQ